MDPSASPGLVDRANALVDQLLDRRRPLGLVVSLIMGAGFLVGFTADLASWANRWSSPPASTQVEARTANAPPAGLVDVDDGNRPAVDTAAAASPVAVAYTAYGHDETAVLRVDLRADPRDRMTATVAAAVTSAGRRPTSEQTTVPLLATGHGPVLVAGSAAIETDGRKVALGPQEEKALVRGGLPVGGPLPDRGVLTFQVGSEPLEVAVTVRARGPHDDEFAPATAVRPGDVVTFAIAVTNPGDAPLEDVAVGDNLPDYVGYVEGSTRLRRGDGDLVAISSDNVTTGGVRIGDIPPGGHALMVFDVRVDDVNVYEDLGVYTLRNVGVVRPAGMQEWFDTADVNVLVESPGDRGTGRQVAGAWTIVWAGALGGLGVLLAARWRYRPR